MKIEQVIGTIIGIVIFASVLPTFIDSTKNMNSTLAQNLNQSYGSLVTFLPVIVGAGVVIVIVRRFISAPEEVDIPALEEGEEEVEDYNEEQITRETKLSYARLETEVECPYCRTMYSRTLSKCPNCYAPRMRSST